MRVRQIGVAGAAADAQAKQFELDQKFGQDARYVQQLAGNYQNYAAGQAMIGRGQGMAEHGVGGGVAGLGAQMAVGVGMGNVMAGGMAQPAARSHVLSGRDSGDLRQVRREAARGEVLRRVRVAAGRPEEDSAPGAASSSRRLPSSAPAAAVATAGQARPPAG